MEFAANCLYVSLLRFREISLELQIYWNPDEAHYQDSHRGFLLNVEQMDYINPNDLNCDLDEIFMIPPDITYIAHGFNIVHAFRMGIGCRKKA